MYFCKNECKLMIRIKEILKEKGMTVSDLSDLLGVSRQALSKQIQGKMLVETAERIANALDVPVSSLFDDYKTGNNVIYCPHCGKPIRFSKDENAK